MKNLLITTLAILAIAIGTELRAASDTLAPVTVEEAMAAEVVQRQLDAYNSGDIDAFVATYHPDVVLQWKGRDPFATNLDDVRRIYGALFEKRPDLYAVILSRSVDGNTVIDRERLVGSTREVIARYEVRDGKIAKVFFERIEAPTAE
ncbi:MULTISPECIES: nuclear transport factor 2 family protein [Kordiimonas]|jgi:hypothetical protein|uniref:nuclear transport factor 2 family protein n=1 Tax=Kordiimonas TaxID=288021 RepID=UPI00257A4829|nr:nuclear transport factor 2 family protein [Kordiimonas sp. UBA4487]